MNKLIQTTINAGEIAVSGDENHVLTVLGLGSCVGVIAFDSAAAIGGIAHIRLPDSTKTKILSTKNKLAFADTGIPWLLQRMENMGASLANMAIVLAGGAEIRAESDLFKVGLQNQDACLQVLDKCGVAVSDRRLGGESWRSVRLFIRSGQLTIQSKAREVELLDVSSSPNNLKLEEKTIEIQGTKNVEKILSRLIDARPPRKRTKIKLKSVDEIKDLLAPLIGTDSQNERNNSAVIQAAKIGNEIQLSLESNLKVGKKLEAKGTKIESKRLKEIYQLLSNLNPS